MVMMIIMCIFYRLAYEYSGQVRKDECLQKLGQTADFLHPLSDYTIHPKPGVSETDEDLFATLQRTEEIAATTNERWEAVTEFTGPSRKPTAVIQTVRMPEKAPLGA